MYTQKFTVCVHKVPSTLVVYIVGAIFYRTYLKYLLLQKNIDSNQRVSGYNNKAKGEWGKYYY